MEPSLVKRFHESARKDDVEGMRLCLNSGLDPSSTFSSSKNSALHLCSAEGAIQATKFLLDEVGVEPDIRNCNGDTPLMFSAMRGKFGVSSILLHRGACVASTNSIGLAPIACAASTGDEATLRLLLRHANAQGMGKQEISELVNMKDFDGRNALHYACESGSEQCVRLLLDSGCSVSDRNKKGESSLSLAKKRNVSKIVEILENFLKEKSPGNDPSTLPFQMDILEEMERTDSHTERKARRKGAPPVVQKGVSRKEEANTSALMQLQSMQRKWNASKLQAYPVLHAGECQDTCEGGDWVTVTRYRAPMGKNDQCTSPTQSENGIPNDHGLLSAKNGEIRQHVGHDHRTSWLDAASTLLEVSFPEAVALDIRLEHVLGLGIADLSPSQIEALQHIHRKALQNLDEARIEVVKQQQRMQCEEEADIKTMLGRYKV